MYQEQEGSRGRLESGLGLLLKAEFTEGSARSLQVLGLTLGAVSCWHPAQGLSHPLSLFNSLKPAAGTVLAAATVGTEFPSQGALSLAATLGPFSGCSLGEGQCPCADVDTSTA